MTKTITLDIIEDLRARFEIGDPEVQAAAREEIGTYLNTGTPTDEAAAAAMGSDYICALADGRIVAWGGEYQAEEVAFGMVRHTGVFATEIVII